MSVLCISGKWCALHLRFGLFPFPTDRESKTRPLVRYVTVYQNLSVGSDDIFRTDSFLEYDGVFGLREWSRCSRIVDMDSPGRLRILAYSWQSRTINWKHALPSFRFSHATFLVHVTLNTIYRHSSQTTSVLQKDERKICIFKELGYCWQTARRTKYGMARLTA